MNGKRFLIIVFALMLTVPMVQIMIGPAEGGKAVFQASIKILSASESLNNQVPKDMVVGSDGGVSVLYESNKNFNLDVFIVHSDDDGLTWGGPIRVDDVLKDGNESNDLSGQLEPSMALGPDDTYYVVWEDRRDYMKDEPLFTGTIKIRFSRSSDGETFTPSKEITRPKGHNSWHAYRPDIAVNSEGRLVCVWEDKDQVNAYRNIWSSYSTDDGDTWSVPIRINTDDIGVRDHEYPRIAMSGDHVYVTWHDGRNTTTGIKPYMAISHDGGETFGEEFPLSSDSQVNAKRDHAYPVVDDSGNLYVVWHDMRSERDEVFFIRSEDNGATFSQDTRPFQIPDEVSDMYPRLTAEGSGEIALVWERHVPYQLGAGQSTETEVFYMNSSDGGRSWSKILKVDDTDRYKTDRTNQDGILTAFNNDGRALCVWKDTRDYVVGSWVYDLYFSRHSLSLTQINTLPVILAPDFLGEYEFNRIIGNTGSVYNFTFTYKDGENDEPGTGYPRIQIFRDAAGTDPVLPEWKPMQRTLGPSDIYFIDGVRYHANAVVPEEGDFFFRIEVTDGVDPTVVSSPVIPGPRIDDTNPTLELTAPEGGIWMSAQRVECRVIVRDEGGAGVRNTSIGYRKSFHGLDHFEDPVPVDGFNRIDNDTYEAWALVGLSPGTENYVKFVARDRVGNGESESDAVNIWLDPEAPYATNARPGPKDIQIYPLVNCSITWRDMNPGSTLYNYTGVEPGTIRYAYKNTSGDFTDWMIPDGYVPNGSESYDAWVHVEFPDEGVFSFIKWSAEDMLGNLFETQPFRISVDVPDNYRPVFFKKNAFPPKISSPTPHIYWEDAYDEEGDMLYYRIQLLKYPSELLLMDWVELGPRTYYDIPNSEALDPNFYILRINVTDRIGGYAVKDHVFQVVDTGIPPPEDLPEFGPIYTRTSDKRMEWLPSPDDDGSYDYWIRVGTRDFYGDILEWKDLGPVTHYNTIGMDLEPGIYSIQVKAFGNGNFSRVAQGVYKISRYDIHSTFEDSHTAYKGSRGIRLTEPFVCYLYNNGTFGDNITVRINGTLVDQGWAFLNSSGEVTDTYFVDTSLHDAGVQPFRFTISIQVPDTAENGPYVLNFDIFSEDGWGVPYGPVIVYVRDAPDEGGGESFTDDFSEFITDILPFLGGLPQWLIIAIFLLIVLLIIAVIVATGIMIAKRSLRKKEGDPYSEQRKVFKEIYGREPTQEELAAMKSQKEEEGSIDDFIKEGQEEAPAKEPAEAPAEGGREGEEAPQERIGPSEVPTVEVKKEKIETGDRETDDLLERLFD
ncbi:MAG: hypothetical protein ACMUIE_07320 [Thermoplasmatota archaeon]